MASLTPRNIVQTSSDLEGLDIHSEVGKTKIPSMYLLDQLSANLTDKLNNLGNILDLNEIKWLGVSTTDPRDGTITINGITYRNDDIDNGNYVTYTAPGTSAELKFIFGHGVWENIGDIVNLPDNFVRNQHISRDAHIGLEKIAGLELADLSNSTYVLSDVTNLKTTLKAMIRDYKQVDINQIISEVQGNVTNTINLCVNGEIANLGIDQKFQNISGSVFNTLNLCMENVYDELNFDIDQQFKDILSVVNNNNLRVDTINSQVANVNSNIAQYYQDIQDIVSENAISIGQIITEYAEIKSSIAQEVADVIGSVSFNNQISENVRATVASLTSTISQSIKDSVINELSIDNRIDSAITAQIASLDTSIHQWIEDNVIDKLINMNTINSVVNAASAYVENTIGTTFNQCNIGSIASLDESYYNETGAYSMRYCGEFISLPDANTQLGVMQTYTRTMTVPVYNASDNTMGTEEKQYELSVNLLDVGSVIAVGDANSGYEYYLCTHIDRSAPANTVWKPLVDDKIYIKKNDISVVTELPPENELKDGKFYVVVDPE